MTPATDNSPPTLLPVRAETVSPACDWRNSWRLLRIRGLSQHSHLLPVQAATPAAPHSNHGLRPARGRLEWSGGRWTVSAVRGGGREPASRLL